MEIKYIKTNIFKFIISYVLLVLFLCYGCYKFFITDSILLERIQNENSIKTFLTNIDNEIKNLKTITNDYSSWDDTYKFIKDKNKKYIFENFREGSNTLKNLNIDSMIYLNLKNQVLFSSYNNNILEEKKNYFEEFIINQFKEVNNIDSIVNFNSTFLYLSKSEILKSDKTGISRGYLITVKSVNNIEVINSNIFKEIKIVNKTLFTQNNQDTQNFDLQIVKNIKISTEVTAKNIINTIDFFDYKNDYIISIGTLNNRELVINSKNTIYIFNIIVSFVLFFVFFFIYKNQYLIESRNDLLNKEVSRRTRQLDKAFRKLKDKNKELYSFAHIDSLTKIKNRRSFFIESEQALQKAILNNQNLCILLIDLDHFKSINDKYGHSIGDKVLVEFCLIVNTILTNESIFGRIGGEEFCITFYNKDLSEINNISEKIRIACSNKNIILENGEILNFTVSMGLSCREDLDEIDKILHKSDELLYEAKKTGRNRLVRSHRNI